MGKISWMSCLLAKERAEGGAGPPHQPTRAATRRLCQLIHRELGIKKIKTSGII
jgi:hypothetical protein